MNTTASLTLVCIVTGDTRIWEGAGETVLSGKRQSYDSWAIARLEAKLEELTAEVAVCKAKTSVQMLHGAGTTNPSKLFWEILGLVEARAKFPVHATYRAVGSSTGQKEFLGASNGNMALNHFGAGDIPMTAERYAAVNASGRTMVHVPFAMGGIGVFHSAPVGGASVHLDACVLAKIFATTITMWNDAEIAALNPDLTLPAVAIKVVHRVKGSSSTAGFTEYMEGACPAVWTLGTGSTIDWPTSTFEGQGSDGMSTFISENEGAIGYIDAGHGHEHGLSEIALLNLDGVYLTTKTADIGAAGTQALASPSVIPEDPSSDFSAVNLYNLPGATTWPITMISYFYIEKDLSGMDPETAALLMAFVKMVLSEEGQSLAEDNMFVKLPAGVLTYNEATLASITLPSGYAALSFELASETLVEVGAGALVLSGKRREYGEWDRSRMETDIEALQAYGDGDAGEVAMLKAKVAQMEAQIAALIAAAPASPPSSSNGAAAETTSNVAALSDDDSGLLYAALICGIFGLLLGLAALIVAINNKRYGKPVQREISFSRPPGEGVSMSARTADDTKADKV